MRCCPFRADHSHDYPTPQHRTDIFQDGTRFTQGNCTCNSPILDIVEQNYVEAITIVADVCIS